MRNTLAIQLYIESCYLLQGVEYSDIYQDIQLFIELCYLHKRVEWPAPSEGSCLSSVEFTVFLQAEKR